MGTATVETKEATAATKRKFTFEELLRLDALGFFKEGERIELVEGEIFVMPLPIGPEHASVVDSLNQQFSSLYGSAVIVRVQSTIQLPEYAPQPDLALLRPRVDFYRGGHPSVEDVLLVVEVADTTLKDDRENRLPRYARAGVREVWIANVQADEFEVHREPIEGTYRLRLIVKPGETIAPLAFPDRPVTL